MASVTVKTQTQLNKIKPDFEGTIYLEGGTEAVPLILRVKFEYAEVIARGDCQLDMRGNSTVQDMWENSTVQDMWGNSTVQDMRGNSTVQRMWENSTVQRMWENSTVQDIYGEAMVSAYGLNKITCHGNNIVRTTEANEKNLTLVMNKDSHLIVIPEFRPTVGEFSKRYPVEVKGTNLILYKAVHKINGKYIADYDKKTEYEIGKKKTGDISKQTDNSCSIGLHVAEKHWAINFGSWTNMALLECEVPKSKIIVSKDCDGKVRTSELKVLREVPKEEWKND